MSDEVLAPWTAEQVKTLNRFQTSNVMHPFTCRRRNEHQPWSEGILIAESDGWLCPACNYRQTWAHSFMADSAFIDRMSVSQRDFLQLFGDLE